MLTSVPKKNGSMVNCAGQYLIRCSLFVYSELSVCRYYCPVEIILNSYHFFFFQRFYRLFFLAVAAQAFLQLRRAGATLQSQCMGFSLWWRLFLWSTGPTAQTQKLRHAQAQWLHGMLNLLGSGIKPMSLALVGGSLPLSHQGSSNYHLLKEPVCSIQQNFINVILKILTLLGFCIS